MQDDVRLPSCYVDWKHFFIISFCTNSSTIPATIVQNENNIPFCDLCRPGCPVLFSSEIWCRQNPHRACQHKLTRYLFWSLGGDTVAARSFYSHVGSIQCSCSQWPHESCSGCSRWQRWTRFKSWTFHHREIFGGGQRVVYKLPHNDRGESSLQSTSATLFNCRKHHLCLKSVVPASAIILREKISDRWEVRSGFLNLYWFIASAKETWHTKITRNRISRKVFVYLQLQTSLLWVCLFVCLFVNVRSAWRLY